MISSKPCRVVQAEDGGHAEARGQEGANTRGRRVTLAPRRKSCVISMRSSRFL